MLSTFLLLGSTAFPVLYPELQMADARSQFVEVKHIPALLSLKQDSWIQTTGLASGKMQFTHLSGSIMQIHQDITLTGIGRAAVEKVVGLTGNKLSSKSNTVAFRFEVKKLPNGTFEYSLFDRGNNQLLLSGPVKVLIAKNTSTLQELEFKAPIVKMTVIIEQEKAMQGKASFSIGVIPVPGSLDFTHYKP